MINQKEDNEDKINKNWADNNCKPDKNKDLKIIRNEEFKNNKETNWTNKEDNSEKSKGIRGKLKSKEIKYKI